MPSWRHHPTWPDSNRDTDRTVTRDRLVVGRVHVVLMPYGPDKWGWSVQSIPASSGLADTLDEALAEIKARATGRLAGRPSYR